MTPSTHRVLVIEPYASGRRAVCTCIAELGHEALAAETASDARVVAASSVVDLIIASWDDGASRSLLKELHARDPGLPTVVLSTSAENAATAPEHAMLLIKPFSLDVLQHAIDSMLHPTIVGS